MKLISKLFNEILRNIEAFQLKDVFDEENHKKFTELVIFVHYTKHLSKQKSNSTLKDFTEVEINKINPDFVFRNFHFAFQILMPYFLIREQKKIAKLEKCIKLLLLHNFTSIEIPPHRELEITYFKNKMNVQVDIELPSNSVLNRLLHLPHLNRELTYSYTHTLFYLLDFGFADNYPDFLNYKKIKFQLECLIVKTYLNQDIDVLLELAINYFSLKKVININPSILKIIEASLIETKFIEFDWKKKKLVNEKYHTFLVLGMLISLIELQIKTFIGTPYSERLSKVYTNSILSDYKNVERKVDAKRLEEMKEFKTWNLLTAAYSKKIDKKIYTTILQTHPFNEYLAESILHNLKLNFDRNDYNIQWDTEYKLLKSTANSKTQLKNEYALVINRLIKQLTTKKEKHSPNIGIANSGA